MSLLCICGVHICGALVPNRVPSLLDFMRQNPRTLKLCVYYPDFLEAAISLQMMRCGNPLYMLRWHVVAKNVKRHTLENTILPFSSPVHQVSVSAATQSYEVTRSTVRTSSQEVRVGDRGRALGG
jgi:hypothetical protein